MAYRLPYGSNLTTHLGIFQAAVCWETPTESFKVVTFCNLVVLTLLLDGRSNWWLCPYLKKMGWWVGSREMKDSDEGSVHLFTFCLFVCSRVQVGDTAFTTTKHGKIHVHVTYQACVLCAFWTGSGVEVFPSKLWWNTLPQTMIAPEKGLVFRSYQYLPFGAQSAYFQGLKR